MQTYLRRYAVWSCCKCGAEHEWNCKPLVRREAGDTVEDAIRRGLYCEKCVEEEK